MRLVLKVVLVLFGAIFFGALGVHLKFESARNEKISIEPRPITIPSDPASVLEGKRLTQVKGCYDCHGTDLGGKLFADAGPVGRYSGSNLTPSGIGSTYADKDWVRAIRHGLAPDGRKLIFMPSAEFASLSDEDLGKIIAFIKSAPEASSDLAPLTVGPLGKVLYLLGKFPLMFQAELIDHRMEPPATVPVNESAAYGKYLAASCVGCHGTEYKGGPIPGVPPDWPAAADLSATGRVQKWSREEFETMLRTGVNPEGVKINPQHMPWTSYSAMTETEMTALYNYILSL